MAQNKNNMRKDDFWSQKAKKDGYPGRAYYKIEEIDGKFKLLKNVKIALDLGAAPGGFSLYMLKNEIKVVAMDLLDLNISEKFTPQLANMSFIKGDFFQNEDKLTTYGNYDAIVSDMAPNTTGNRVVDCSASLELATACLLFSTKYLKKDGNILMKFFQGEDNQKVIENELKANFREVKFYKPQVSRSFSFEIFAIGIGKKI